MMMMLLTKSSEMQSNITLTDVYLSLYLSISFNLIWIVFNNNPSLNRIIIGLAIFLIGTPIQPSR